MEDRKNVYRIRSANEHQARRGARPKLRVRSATPFRDAVASFFRSNYDLAPKTTRWYRQNLDAFSGFVERTKGGRARLSDLSKLTVEAFLTERIVRPTRKYPRGSAFAARAAAATLKRLANYLAAEGMLADDLGRSVLMGIRSARPDDDARQPLSDADLKRVLHAAGPVGGRDHAIVLFMVATGVRANEAREARTGDLDLDAGTFRVRPETSKFGRGRVVYLHPAVCAALDRYIRLSPFGGRSDQPLFPTRTGGLFDEHGWAKVFVRIRVRSGVRSLSAHVLRHTWATNYMRSPGASVLELKRQGGWTRWEMVERYSHALPVKSREALPNPLLCLTR